MQKDIYETIVKNADDRTVINMMIANTNLYKDDQVWYRIVQYKYLLLTKYKKEKESWKTFYLSMVKNISILKEKFDFPYIPVDGFNPRSYYFSLKIAKGEERNIWNYGMGLAIKSGENKWINYMLIKGATNFNMLMKEAKTYNFEKSEEKLKISVKNSEIIFEDELSAVAYFGYVDLIFKLFQKDKEYNYGAALLKAIDGNQLGAFRYILQNGLFMYAEPDIDNALLEAFKQGRNDFLKVILSPEGMIFMIQIARVINKIYKEAVETKNEEVVKIIKKWILIAKKNPAFNLFQKMIQ